MIDLKSSWEREIENAIDAAHVGRRRFRWLLYALTSLAIAFDYWELLKK